MPSKHPQKRLSFESLLTSAGPAAQKIEELTAESPPDASDFFHSIVHRHRVRRYSSFLVDKKTVYQQWPADYKRKFGSAVQLKCQLGLRDSALEAELGKKASVHVMDIGSMMSGPRGRAQGGVSAVLLGKACEELLVLSLGSGRTPVRLLSLEVDYLVSGMLPLVAKTLARFLEVRRPAGVAVYSLEAVLVDNAGTICSYGIASYVEVNDIGKLPKNAVPFLDPAFGPHRDPEPAQPKPASYFASSKLPGSIPPFLKPLWTDKKTIQLTNLIPGIVPNPMMLERDGFRGGFIWGTQFGQESVRETGLVGPPAQVRGGIDPDTTGISHRAFTRAFQLLDARSYYSTPEKERKVGMAEGVTIVELGKGCGGDSVVAEKLGWKMEERKEVHTGFLFSVSSERCRSVRSSTDFSRSLRTRFARS
jgi:hypothetical protein